MQIRQAIVADMPQLAILYYDTVSQHGPTYYTAHQTQAWANFVTDAESFRRFILDVRTYIAEESGIRLGFGGISPAGRITSLYVHRAHLGEGIGSRLLQHLIAQAEGDQMPRLYAEASRFSLGLFEKFGFRQYDIETVERSGVLFERYLVEKWLH